MHNNIYYTLRVVVLEYKLVLMHNLTDNDGTRLTSCAHAHSIMYRNVSFLYLDL